MGPFKKPDLKAKKCCHLSHVKDTVEAIYFHIKSKGGQGLIFVQIMFKMWTTNLYFENDEVGIKTTSTNL